jgi:hypothetical protein
MILAEVTENYRIWAIIVAQGIDGEITDLVLQDIHIFLPNSPFTSLFLCNIISIAQI